jgi:hypothetical protein
MTWIMVSSTRTGIAFSDVLTRAETSRPRHIDASPSIAMPISSSTSGRPVSNAPWEGSGSPITPSRTRTTDCSTLITPSTISLENR